MEQYSLEVIFQVDSVILNEKDIGPALMKKLIEIYRVNKGQAFSLYRGSGQCIKSNPKSI